MSAIDGCYNRPINLNEVSWPSCLTCPVLLIVVTVMGSDMKRSTAPHKRKLEKLEKVRREVKRRQLEATATSTATSTAQASGSSGEGGPTPRESATTGPIVLQ